MTVQQRFEDFASQYRLTPQYVDDIDHIGPITRLQIHPGLPWCAEARPTAAVTGLNRCLQLLLTKLRQKVHNFDGSAESLLLQVWLILHLPAKISVSEEEPFIAVIKSGEQCVFSDGTAKKSRVTLRDLVCRQALRHLAELLGPNHIPPALGEEKKDLTTLLRKQNDKLTFSLNQHGIICAVFKTGNQRTSVCSRKGCAECFIRRISEKLSKMKLAAEN